LVVNVGKDLVSVRVVVGQAADAPARLKGTPDAGLVTRSRHIVAF
jgi:hypothetical protein